LDELKKSNWLTTGLQSLTQKKPVPSNALRTTNERMKSTQHFGHEALSPKELRSIFESLNNIIEPKISDVEGGRRAAEIVDWCAKVSQAKRYDCWLLMSEQFMADAGRGKKALAKYAAAVGTVDEAVAEVRYRQSTVLPRRRLLQRFSALPQGIRFLVDMRSAMVPFLASDQRLHALDVEMEYMFSTWFEVGFLELRHLSWDSPASLIEKLIQYEAVHDIKSWADLKNRLDSDRRCYGFFHPSLPNEPLIFVEVALLNEVATSIAPLLDETAPSLDSAKANVAIFYSISNTQVGLKGVSFGDSLIKRVVETLKEEFPKLRTFATLSPIPGFRSWLQKKDPSLLTFFESTDIAQLSETNSYRKQATQLAAYYLVKELKGGKPLDPVARFHLGNGARVERINWAADQSDKGLKQSLGLMVNYLYDVKKLDKNRDMLHDGVVPFSNEISKLL
jgi:malonyl-CoA decarboxylase